MVPSRPVHSSEILLNTLSCTSEDFSKPFLHSSLISNSYHLSLKKKPAYPQTSSALFVYAGLVLASLFQPRPSTYPTVEYTFDSCVKSCSILNQKPVAMALFCPLQLWFIFLPALQLTVVPVHACSWHFMVNICSIAVICVSNVLGLLLLLSLFPIVLHANPLGCLLR